MDGASAPGTTVPERSVSRVSSLGAQHSSRAIERRESRHTSTLPISTTPMDGSSTIQSISGSCRRRLSPFAQPRSECWLRAASTSSPPSRAPLGFFGQPRWCRTKSPRATGAAGRVVDAGSLILRSLHPAGGDWCHRVPQKGSRLRSILQNSSRHAHHDRRRSAGVIFAIRFGAADARRLWAAAPPTGGCERAWCGRLCPATGRNSRCRASACSDCRARRWERRPRTEDRTKHRSPSTERRDAHRRSELRRRALDRERYPTTSPSAMP